LALALAYALCVTYCSYLYSSFPGTFTPWNESSQNETSRQRKFPGTFIHTVHWERKFPAGTFTRSENTGERKVPEPAEVTYGSYYYDCDLMRYGHQQRTTTTTTTTG